MINLLHAAVLMVFPALVVIAALTDVLSFTIPNRISVILALAFLPAALMLGLPPAALGMNLGVGAAALVAGMAMFALGWIGGGDAKLFAVSGLWLGLPAAGTFLMVTALAGGALALILLNARSQLVRPYLSHAPAWVGRLAQPGGDVPYGFAIAIGALVAFPQSGLMQAFHGIF
jgi:prepilin peptidase CpaA